MNVYGAGAIASPFGPLKPTVSVRSGFATCVCAVASVSVKTTRLSPTRNPPVIGTGRIPAAPEAAGKDLLGTEVGAVVVPQAATRMRTATDEHRESREIMAVA